MGRGGTVAGVVRRARARMTVTQQIANAVLTIWAFAATFTARWVSLLVALSIWPASAALAALLTRFGPLSSTVAPRPIGGLEGDVQEEVRRARRDDLSFWWDLPDKEIRGCYLSLWRRVTGIDAERMVFRHNGRRLRDRLDHDALPEAKPERKKAVMVEVEGLLYDEDPAVVVAEGDWELARWVEANRSDLALRNQGLSAFGLGHQDPVPHILCCHAVVRTADGHLLLCLRRPAAGYHPLAWSASVEEQVELGALPRDPNVAVTVRRGLREELGIVDDRAEIAVMSIGYESVVDDDRHMHSGVVICDVRLTLPLSEVWRRVSARAEVEDVAEHVAWVGLRISRSRQVPALLEVAAERGGISPTLIADHPVLDIGVQVHPASDLGATGPLRRLHPTSRARLEIWNERAVARGDLD